jgi:Ca2+-binding RTX toxin-like protein
MAVSVIPGTAGSDIFRYDPLVLSHASIIDLGGSADVLQILDRPGRTSGEFAVEGSSLVFRPFTGDSSVSIGMVSGVSEVEFLEWQRLPEDGTPYTLRLRIITDFDEIFGSKFAVAGTQEDDTISAPKFSSSKSDWSEIYGNGGDDTLKASNKHLVFLYGGDGDDILRGTGRMDDYFLGDDGQDLLRGGRGDDELFGGAGNDRIFGQAGDDVVSGDEGNDRLFGDKGNDTLEGGLGTDFLSGGRGADEFVYGTTNLGRDTITNFQLGIDKIILDGIETTNFSILAQSAGGAVVTVLSSGQQIYIDNLAATVIQSRAADIFELG